MNRMRKTFDSRCFRPVSAEFSRANFGDVRLTKRLMEMSDAMAVQPDETLPKILGGGAGIEGGYRFLRNSKVNFDAILEPHFEQTVLRSKVEGDVLVVHDTTEFRFSSKRRGLGLLTRSGSVGDGFYAHFSLVLGVRSNRPLGVLAVEPMINLKRKGYQTPATVRIDPTRKSLRWMRAIKTSEDRLGSDVKPIHVMDREADFFELFSQMTDSASRCVVRVCRDRLVTDKNSEEVPLYNALGDLPVRLEREIYIGKRERSPLPRSRKRHPPREARTATLSATAATIELIRSQHNTSELHKKVKLNVVNIFESNPPEGSGPVDWKLFTTEPVSTRQEIERVIDIYRARWGIEEYFKAIKTGCAYEERQLESKKTILNALAVFVPIAWRMLLLRSEARHRPNVSAKVVLTTTQIDVLRAISKRELRLNPTAHEALSAIAALGGHLKQNGPPGWRILAKGLNELLTLEKGWLARERCDQ